MFRPVLTIFRLSYGNLRSYYKQVRARGVEISTYGPYCLTTYNFPSFIHTTWMTQFLDIH